jgi:molybdenum cofactor biosynthesis enzyme MoaA
MYAGSYTGVLWLIKPQVEPLLQRSLQCKRLKSSEDAIDEFRVQMEVLPRVHHNNVVGYAEFCMEKGEEILVFEYMPNDSLDKWLFGTHMQRGRILSQRSEDPW